MKALSKRNDDPAASAETIRLLTGRFCYGEGAGILILENYEKAVARGAKIYAEIVGHGATSDAYHITNTLKVMVLQLLKMAIDDAGVDVTEVGYVNAHGTSTPLEISVN